MCVDKTKAIFVQDALEVIDKTAPDFVNHQMFIPHMIKNADTPYNKVMKYIGNVVIPGNHVKTILLDKKFQKLYDEQHQKVLDEKIKQEKEEAEEELKRQAMQDEIDKSQKKRQIPSFPMHDEEEDDGHSHSHGHGHSHHGHGCC